MKKQVSTFIISFPGKLNIVAGLLETCPDRRQKIDCPRNQEERISSGACSFATSRVVFFGLSERPEKMRLTSACERKSKTTTMLINT